ncbi:tetratricopeptide repeat protein 12-like isoform X1 [Nasonia vitripennis]|uniref:Tetratricopeptide repeat protein 12 n=2 Tax=Nasonia vitripennis TaxID=7425 RepID=A0A7M7LIY9_NASVI|nr:tetratricopeptide repeat protein 12-like isoform X1 [Nasonia vitripennis]
MEHCLKSDNFGFNPDEESKILNSFSNSKADRNVTEEEFQNFMHRVTEVEKIVKQLASTDVNDQERGMFLADEILQNNVKTDVSDIGELKAKTNRTLINKYSAEESDPNKISQEAFKRSVERDAAARAEDRKARNERAETYKRIGNGAFKESDYEKAVTYFSKALEQRRDSAVLWNNRALSYMRLGLFEKALLDCNWALKVNEANIKALLNSAKCHKSLGNEEQCRNFIQLARERNPKFQSYISEFERNLESEATPQLTREAANDLID